MKRTYERSLMYCEEFRPNRAIAACEQKDVVFDCMMGGNRDITNVITAASSCSRQAETSTATTAKHLGSRGHSNVTGGTWSGGNSNLTYTAPDDAEGLLYICTYDGNNSWTLDKWSDNSAVLTHDNSHQPGSGGGGGRRGNWHCQIAPIYGYNDVNTGS